MTCENNTLSHLPNISNTVTPLTFADDLRQFLEEINNLDSDDNSDVPNTVTPLTFADDLIRQLIEEINNLDSDDNSDVPDLIEFSDDESTVQK